MRSRDVVAFLPYRRTPLSIRQRRCPPPNRDRYEFLDLSSAPVSASAPIYYPPPTFLQSSLASPVGASAISGAASEAVATATATAVATSSAARTVSFLWGCLIGGIIGSATLAIFAAGAAYGIENVSRALGLANAVWSRVWSTFTSGLNLARKTLVKYRRWRFGEAWDVLREELALTRKTAAEGIEAIRVEASLYSGVVGKLGFPLAQYAVDNLSPKLGAYLAKQNLLNALAQVENKNIRRMDLVKFDFGTRPPKLISARTYELREESAMAIDVDLIWDSDLEATIRVTPKLMGINKRTSIVAIPVTLKNCRFEGVVRVILTPLTDEPPGFGAALISFPKAPVIGLDCTVSSVDVTKNFPWLKADLMKELEKSIANEFLWPKRIIVPSGVMPKTPKPVLDRAVLEELSKTDPLLRAQQNVDDNELVQKYEMRRDVAKEEELVDNMKVFVGDEEERIRQLNSTMAGDAVGNQKGRPGYQMGGFKFELPKMWWDKNGTDADNASNEKMNWFSLDLPWQKNKQGEEKSNSKAAN